MKSTSPELPFPGILLPRIAVALCALLGCAQTPPVDEDAAPFPLHEDLSSIEQALSADPGPKTIFDARGNGYPSRLDGTRSDGTYVYVNFYSDLDRSCWGHLLRMPVGAQALTVDPRSGVPVDGGSAESVSAPCFTQGFAAGHGGAYFRVVNKGDSQDRSGKIQSSGIYRVSFGLNDLTQLTSVEPHAIAADGTHVYWNEGAALHRMLPDGTGDEILAADVGGSTLLVDDTSVYGSDADGRWKVPKTGGARVTLTTEGTGGLILDRGELWFWVKAGQIGRLSVMGGTPRTFYEGEPYDSQTGRGLSGLAVAGDWVYWSEDDALKRRAKAGGTVETIVTDEVSARVLAADATNVYYSRVAPKMVPPWLEFRRLPIADIVAPFCADAPRRLADAAGPLGLAAAGSWIYYTDADTVRRVWKNGGTVETVAINKPGARALHASVGRRAWVTDDGVSAMGIQYAYPYKYLGGFPADATDVVIGPSDPTVVLYYTDGARLVGPADATLALGLAPYRLAVDESWLYWTDRGDQTVNRVARAGGSVELLARMTSGEIGDLELDLDSDELIFGVDDGDSGRILRVPKTGGAAALVAQGAFSPFALEAAGPSVYFTSQGPDAGTVYRVAKRGGTPAVLVKGGAAFELDTLGSCVFYGTDTGIDVVSCHGTTAADDLNAAEPCGLCNAGACDDHDPCTSADACSGGACVGTDIDCTAMDGACVVGTCNRADGACEAVHISNGAACSDGDACTDGDACDRGRCVSGDDICAGGAAPDAAVTPADAGGTSSVDGGGDAEGATDAGAGAEGAADASGGADQETGGGRGDDGGATGGDGARDGGPARSDGVGDGDADRHARWGCGVLGMRPSRGPAGLGSALLFLLLARLRRRCRG